MISQNQATNPDSRESLKCKIEAGVMAIGIGAYRSDGLEKKSEPFVRGSGASLEYTHSERMQLFLIFKCTNASINDRNIF